MYYAKLLKWHVFPAIPGNKEPLTTNGFYDATTDRNQIYKWWSNNPCANVAIRTGKESGFIVIDVDGEEGERSLEQLTEKHEPLPETVESVTGSGGRHILFKYPDIDGIIIPSRIGWLGEDSKVDIKADGGYIVAAPSIHPNGNTYEWEISSRPLENEIAEIPEWLLQHLVVTEQEKEQKKPSSHWTSIMSGVNEGGRDNAATSLVGHLFRRYVDPVIVIEVLEMWNERNNPPLPAKDLEKVFLSIWRKEQSKREEQWVLK